MSNKSLVDWWLGKITREQYSNKNTVEESVGENRSKFNRKNESSRELSVVLSSQTREKQNGRVRQFLISSRVLSFSIVQWPMSNWNKRILHCSEFIRFCTGRGASKKDCTYDLSDSIFLCDTCRSFSFKKAAPSNAKKVRGKIRPKPNIFLLI